MLMLMLYQVWFFLVSNLTNLVFYQTKKKQFGFLWLFLVLLNMSKRDDEIRRFFEISLQKLELSHGRKPVSREDMWEAINEEIERSDRERRSSS